MRRKGKQISHDFIHMESNFKNRHESKKWDSDSGDRE